LKVRVQNLWVALVLLALYSLHSALSTAFAQGSLTPPGPPGPTMARSVTGLKSRRSVPNISPTTMARCFSRQPIIFKHARCKIERSTMNFHRLTLAAITTSALMLFASRPALAGTVYVGNSLTVENGGSDGSPPFVILGEYSPAGPLAAPSTSTTLPSGSVVDVKFYGNNYNFTLYALSYVSAGSKANEQKFKVVASQQFSGSPSTGVQTLSVTGFSVNAGNLLAFAGTGPYYAQSANDATDSDATYENSSSVHPSGRTAAWGLFRHPPVQRRRSI
jgi:hypothetical protein